MVSRTAVAVLGIGLLVAGGGGIYLYTLGTNFQNPTVESVNSEFGTITNETAVVHSRVVLDNPNEESLPVPATVEYVVRMNDRAVATGRNPGIRLSQGRNVVDLTAEFDNSKIPAWWVTHVDDDGRTTLTTTGRVSLSGLPVGASLPTRRRTIETDIPGALTTEGQRQIGLANETLLVVSNERAAWGDATAERTPVRFSVGLENVHDRPVAIDGTDYVVEMNGLVVGRGTTNDSVRLAPGDSETFVTDVVIDTRRMQRWWVSHLRNNQSTTIRVGLFAVVEEDGDRTRLPLAMYDARARFDTDLLSGGATTVRPLPKRANEPLEKPWIDATASRWGNVTDRRAEIVTRSTVHNPNSAAFGDVLDVRVGVSTTIAGIAVREGTGRLDGLDEGANTLTIRGPMPHRTVPRWWARHVNAGERSTVETTTNGTVDLGVTAVSLDAPDRTRTVETDFLRSLESDRPRPLRVEGRTVGVISSTRAEWGETTPTRAPVTVSLTVENEESSPLTIEDVGYLVELAGVTLADDHVGQSYTIQPRATETIELQLELNNSRMAEWWPAHVRNGERSTLHTETEATVAVGDHRDRVTLEGLTGNATVETDVLGRD